MLLFTKTQTLIFLLLIGVATKSFAKITFESLPMNSITDLKYLPQLQPNILPVCFQPAQELVLVKIPYWGFDEQEHAGGLIVHKALGNEVIAIFQALFKHHYPIQVMYPIPYKLQKDPDILNNITAAFSCRKVTDQPGILSQHGYGRAIDINPMINPYTKGCLVIPEFSEEHVNRIKPEKGKIIPNSFVQKVFAQYGWDWGGNWFDIKDYHHFEKRANGEKRNPYGYITPHFRYNIFDNCERLMPSNKNKD